MIILHCSQLRHLHSYWKEDGNPRVQRRWRDQTLLWTEDAHKMTHHLHLIVFIPFPKVPVWAASAVGWVHSNMDFNCLHFKLNGALHTTALKFQICTYRHNDSSSSLFPQNQQCQRQFPQSANLHCLWRWPFSKLTVCTRDSWITIWPRIQPDFHCSDLSLGTGFVSACTEMAFLLASIAMSGCPRDGFPQALHVLIFLGFFPPILATGSTFILFNFRSSIAFRSKRFSLGRFRTLLLPAKQDPAFNQLTACLQHWALRHFWPKANGTCRISFTKRDQYLILIQHIILPTRQEER